MDVYLLSAPAGFGQGLSALSQALQAPEIATDLVQRAAHSTIRPDESEKIQPYQSMFSARKVNLSCKDIVNILRCLAFINRGADMHCQAGSIKSLGKALVGSTNATEEVAAIVAKAWAKSASVDKAADEGDGEPVGENSFSVGKLQALDWKLGVRLSSNKCDRLNTPFVRLAFRVSDNAGVEKMHIVQVRSL